MRMLTLLTATTFVTAPLAAQGWIEPLPNRPMNGVVKVRTAVSVQVDGRIALVEVEEWFENRGGGLGEGDYIYPLPGEAVFSNFSLFQGDEELRGETMDADRARAIYEEIVRRKKDPALIELVGHGLVRARVFPINSGETRKITLRYTQVMERAGESLAFQYAAGGTTSMTQLHPDTPTGPRRQASGAPISFRLTADSGDAYRDPFSPTHELEIDRNDGRLVVRPAESLSGDFVVFLPFARETVGITLATHRPNGQDGYFMLTLSPGEARGASLPRDITAVVDVSGSMSGEKLEQAKAALRQLLSSLGRRDRFRLVAFSSRVWAHDGDWTRATAENVRDARRWVDELDADGGTNIEGALDEAFHLDAEEGRLPLVIFLTDGLPSVGEENPEQLAAQAERARGDARVFAFGVGYDVNTYLLDRLSDAGRGTTQYVRPGEDVEDAVGQMVRKVQHPVLADLEIADSPVRLLEVYPERLPDLFAGEELVVFGRYRGRDRDSRGELAIAGHRASRSERYATAASFPEHSNANDFIPQLWASRKIGYLSQAIRLNGPSEELIEEIRETALEYGLLSEYTSYLVQEPMEVALGEGRGRRAMPTVMDAAAQMASPASASGAVAVNSAEQSRVRREVKSKGELEEVAADMAKRAHGPNARHVAGRLFVEREGVWTDMMHADSVDVVEIAPFSDAYFKVLERIPELTEYVTEFGEVLVAGKTASIKFVDGGEEILSPLRLSQLEQGFKGK